MRIASYSIQVTAVVVTLCVAVAALLEVGGISRSSGTVPTVQGIFEPPPWSIVVALPEVRATGRAAEAVPTAPATSPASASLAARCRVWCATGAPDARPGYSTISQYDRRGSDTFFSRT